MSVSAWDFEMMVLSWMVISVAALGVVFVVVVGRVMLDPCWLIMSLL